MVDTEERPLRSRSRLPTTYRKALQRAITRLLREDTSHQAESSRRHPHFHQRAIIRLLREDTSGKSSSIALSSPMGTSSRTLHHPQALAVLMKGPRWVRERPLLAG